MSLERITSKDNAFLRRIAKLAQSGKTRLQEGEYVCEGKKLLSEAIRDGVEICGVVCSESGLSASDPAFSDALGALSCRKIALPDALFAHVSILENSPGPLFLCRIPEEAPLEKGAYIALDGVQDPGNIGTILRTAEAFGMRGVILLEGCADVFQPKVVRASMGSIFRQRVLHMDSSALFEKAKALDLPVYATALYENSRSLRDLPPGDAVVLIGSEGHGVREENIRRSTGSVLIPMRGKTESLNAAVAAAVVMWEMSKWQENTGSGFPS